MATPDKPHAAPVLVLLHNKHAAVYFGREQQAVYTMTRSLTSDDVEVLRLEWEASRGHP